MSIDDDVHIKGSLLWEVLPIDNDGIDDIDYDVNEGIDFHIKSVTVGGLTH